MTLGRDIDAVPGTPTDPKYARINTQTHTHTNRPIHTHTYTKQNNARTHLPTLTHTNTCTQTIKNTTKSRKLPTLNSKRELNPKC